MFIEKFKNNGKDYLRLVHAVKKTNKNGDMVSTNLFGWKTGLRHIS